MAGPSLVITCGHCVFKSEFGGWPRQISVTPGLSESLTPFGSVVATAFSAAEPWKLDAEKRFDIGAIHLPSPLGSRTGWFAMKAAEQLVGRTATIAGYPVFDGEHSRQLRESDRIVAVDGGRIYHTIDTDSGQSGAPIWIDEDNRPTVVGVHAYEADQTPPSIAAEANSGTLLTSDMLSQISVWQRSP
jgi:V8-like Glu-specific endopeptidase